MSTDDNLQDYQKDQVDQIYKETFRDKTANLIAGVILFVPIGALWAVFYFFLLTKPFFVHMAPNIRGIIFMAVLIIPVLIVIFLRPIIKNFFINKFK